MVSESSSSMKSSVVGGDLHQRFQIAQPIPDLGQGNPPSNGVSWLRSCMIFIRQMGGMHFLNPEWSVEASEEASENVGDDKVKRLMAMRRKERRAVKKEPKHVDAAPKNEHKDQPAGELPRVPDGDSDSEGAGFAPRRRTLGDVRGTALLASAGKCGERFYMDPLTGLVEAAPDLICEKIMSTTDANHGYLIAGIGSGDLASFMIAAAKIIEGHEDGRVMTAVRGIATLRKEPKMKMAEFVARAATYRKIVTTSGFGFDSRLIREAFIQSLACDPQYAMEVSFARNDDKVTVDDIVRSVLLKSRSVEASGANSGLTGLMTEIPRPSPRPSPKPKLAACYNMRDFGECRFGDRCKYTHQDTGDLGAAKKPRQRESDGGCYECGKAHSISKCKEFADRKATQAALKLELAEAKALMATVDAPVGSVATIKFPKPDAATALAVWGN